MNEIFLNNVFRLTDDEIKNSKISLNIREVKTGPLCIDSWLKDKYAGHGFCAYLGKKNNFRLDQYCFAFYKLGWSGDQYLFVGAGKITEIPPIDRQGPCKYKTIKNLEIFVGRLVINVHKGNKMGRYVFPLKNWIENCEVVEILSKDFELEKFPGFKNLRLDYNNLYKSIYLNHSWKELLQSQKAVYAIVDKAPEDEYSGLGRIYVGSATGSRGMLFDRWKNYVDTLTGGNKEFEKLKKLKGEEYIKKYFQWSLLEHFDEDERDAVILEREKY